MNKLYSLFATSLLAVLMVFLGAGVSMVECGHTGRTTLAQLDCWGETMVPAPMAVHEAPCHEAMSSQPGNHAAAAMTARGCMAVEQWQLSPITVGHSVVDWQPAAQPLLAVLPQGGAEFAPHHLPGMSAPTLHAVPHAPPRAYLRRLRRLLV